MTVACPWCGDTGWITRVRTCSCRAPERASDVDRLARWAGAAHDPKCHEGWVYSRTPCDCNGAVDKRQHAHRQGTRP
jgi:hypothetical protein